MKQTGLLLLHRFIVFDWMNILKAVLNLTGKSSERKGVQALPFQGCLFIGQSSFHAMNGILF